MDNKLKTFLLLLLFVIAEACGTQKKALAPGITSREPKALAKVMTENAFDFEFFSAKSKTHFEGKGLNENFTLNLRMQRDKKIWLSAQAVLGIEVARMLVTEDSIFMLQNFPQRSFKAMSLAEISKVLAVTVNIRQIQDLFLGNPITSYENARVDLQNDSIVVENKISDFLVREFIHPDMPRIGRMNLQSTRDRSWADFCYSDYIPQGNKTLPKKVNIFVRSQDLEANCELNYYDISTEPISSFPFRIPEGY